MLVEKIWIKTDILKSTKTNQCTTLNQDYFKFYVILQISKHIFPKSEYYLCKALSTMF